MCVSCVSVPASLIGLQFAWLIERFLGVVEKDAFGWPFVLTCAELCAITVWGLCIRPHLQVLNRVLGHIVHSAHLLLHSHTQWGFGVCLQICVMCTSRHEQCFNLYRPVQFFFHSTLLMFGESRKTACKQQATSLHCTCVHASRASMLESARYFMHISMQN